jgi:acetyltransferase-like isoleucine patch superfamily enzyme
MNLISKIFRYLENQRKLFLCFFRILKLKLLYPGISIDFKTKIQNNCTIVCVKGGKLTILNSHISTGTQIVADENSILSIYSSFVGRNCVISAKEKIIINENCLIAEMVVIRDQDHAIDLNEANENRENFNIAPIEINENVWIASKATILRGVTIGKFSVVAASAVVTKVIPPYEVWAGIPAKFIREIKFSGK